MTNHVHLMVTPSDHGQLARFVQSFSQSYSQFRNGSRNASGKLFEQRYKCVPITDEEQIAITTAYIELNPIRAKLCAEPEAYRWSTFAQHAGCEAKEPLVAKLWSPSAWYMSLGSEPGERVAVFRDWFAHYRARDDWSRVYRDPSAQGDGKRFERPNRSSSM